MKRETAHRRCGFAAAFEALALASAGFAQTVYVDIDATGSNNGSSWANAWTDFQDALQFARDTPQDLSEIWVAEGTYYPDNDQPGNRFLSFDMTDLDDVTPTLDILGGFNGTETSASQRNPATHVTILSGDLDGDDSANFVNRDDNSHHVVYISKVGESLTIDGFTIKAGYADDIENRGGGILQVATVPAVGPRFQNCIITDNFADRGGGIGASVLQMNLRACRVFGNKAREGAGAWGGGYIRNSFIFSNVAEEEGGGALLTGSIFDGPRFNHCKFISNKAIDGGGLASTGARVDVRNSTFTSNEADDGGGIYSQGPTVLRKCTIENNIAVDCESSQMYVTADCKLIDCAIRDDARKLTSLERYVVEPARSLIPHKLR